MFSSERSILSATMLVILGLGLAACWANSTDPIETAGVSDTRPAAPEKTQSTVASRNPILSPPDLGPAPDFTNEAWINTAAPLTLDGLRGKVVLVEFWTYD
jgi:hypothetical protein